MDRGDEPKGRAGDGGAVVMPIRAMCIAGAVLLAAVPGCGPATEPATLAQRLQSDKPAERVNAIVEAGKTSDRSAVPLLVDRLEDEDSDVRMFAILSLEKITGQTFGYQFYADPADRRRAVEKWRSWLRGAAAPAAETQTSSRG